MGFAIDGLVSGLDTTAMIESLMKVETAPQTLLSQKKLGAEKVLTALQALNAKVSSVTDAATAAAKVTSWDVRKATSSSETVTATTSTGASIGSVTFSVDAVATSQISLSDAAKDGATLMGGRTTLTIKRADGTVTEVTPTGTDFASIARAINDSDAGVKATAVRVSSGEPPEYRLQMTGTSTGTSSTFAVFGGTAADVEAGTALPIDTSTARAATDAKLTLWKGSDMEVSFEQSSNTFVGLMNGVDVTVTKVTPADAAPVTVSVAQDDAALTKLAADLVSQLDLVLSEIKSRTATATTTDGTGKTVVSGGLLSGDSAVRALQQNLLSSASRPVDGLSPSTVGIVVGRDGTFSFDEKKFAEALAADPAAVQRMVMGVAAAVQEVGSATSDKYEGTLTSKITNHQSSIRTMGDQISDWDRRLEIRREGLQRTWSALEVTLSDLNTQQSWLTGQLASLGASAAS